ncbi:integrase [Pseudomonas sp. IB20]|uniref:tyrosine-type recombinase/integrase n=1 Tax=Pseudomonas sp. IB20 TaxID=1702250 RepID=UPI000BA12DBA|nr:site-specific integrase [Pseudomonas sp. IB20]OZO04538.1 integrase [Pseudomonas sp. IB20]
MSVKNSEVYLPKRVAKAKKVTFESGERSCVIVDDLGMPLYYPNLYLTTQVRNKSNSASTLTNNAGHLGAFLQVMEEYQIDLVARLSEGKVLDPHEVESLRGILQRRLVAQTEGRAGPTYFSSHEYISKDVMHARIGVATGYLGWLASLYLRNPRDSDELPRVIAAMREIRPVSKKRNRINRKRGLSAASASAVLEVLRPGSHFNIWEQQATQVRNRLILSLMYELGIRRGEMLNLMIEDFDFRANRVSIMRRADEKSDPRLDQPLVKTNDRIIPLKPSIIKEVQIYISEYRRAVPGSRKHGFLFVTHKSGPTQGQPLSIGGYKYVIHSLRRDVPPLSEFSGHDLRHYWNERFSDLMDKANVPHAEEELMRSELMGWKFGSGTAATYNQRYIERKAAEYGLKLQEASLPPSKVKK